MPRRFFRSPRRVSRVLLLLAAALTVAPIAFASSAAPGFPSAGVPPRLEAGTSVEIGWTFPVPAEFDEVELLLSVDGGRTFPIRVTRDLPAKTDRVVWRVPFLRTRHARLALRSGERGDERSETIRFVSDEFAIDVASEVGMEPLFGARGELATREALESLPRPDFFGGSVGRPLEQISTASRRMTAAIPRSVVSAARIATSKMPFPDAPPARTRARLRPLLGRPTLSPLRL